MDIIRKDYVLIKIGERLELRYEDGEGQLIGGSFSTVNFAKDELEDLMAAFNWLYHDAHSKHK